MLESLGSLILFDESRPSPELTSIFIWAVAILIVSNFTFLILCKLMGVDTAKTLDNEKSKEYAEWVKRGISPWSVTASEIMNSTIYSPVAEEMAFRVILQKFLLTRGAGLNPIAAVIIQGIIFGIMHLSNSVYTTQSKKYTYMQALSATISGIVSGWVYYHTNSVLPSLLAHAINNGAAGVSEVSGYVKYRKTHAR
jgi:membrane protease YdiL (CAAX protease family)